MTEIPEHLLKRSKERRSAMGLPGGEADAGAAGTPATASTTPAVVAGGAPPAKPPAAAPTPAPAPPPRPLPDYVVAAKTRRKIPFWAMPVLAALPIWLFIYAEAMQPPPVKLTGPLAVGATLFTGNCAACHGAAGEGGVGPKLAEGAVFASFPKFEQQYSFVTTGSAPYLDKPYGAANKTGINGMPSWKGQGFTADQIMAAVCHERFTLAGVTPASVPAAQLADYNKYCAPDAPEYLKAQDEGAKYPLYANPPSVAAG